MKILLLLIALSNLICVSLAVTCYNCPAQQYTPNSQQTACSDTCQSDVGCYYQVSYSGLSQSRMRRDSPFDNLGQQMQQQVQNGFQNGMDNAGNYAQQGWQQIQNGAQQIGQDLQNGGMQKVGDYAQQGLQQVQQGAQQLGQSIQNGFNSLQNNMADIGQQAQQQFQQMASQLTISYGCTQSGQMQGNPSSGLQCMPGDNAGDFKCYCTGSDRCNMPHENRKKRNSIWDKLFGRAKA
ncbi:hypothetical protein Ddc_17837 [Ditylenchus destructor]|nr:hypothetical protein Ddc_17837 [Ditylenchus destructor]